MKTLIVKEHFLSIGIAVLLLMTLYYGVNSLVSPPKDPRYIDATNPNVRLELPRSVEPQVYTNFQMDVKKHRRIVSPIYIAMGLLTLLAGVYWLKLELLSTAFVFGGLFMTITSLASGWESYFIRFGGSVLCLAAVIVVVKKKFSSSN